MLHVCRIAPRSEDTGNFGGRINVVRSDQGSSRIVDQRCKLNRQILAKGGVCSTLVSPVRQEVLTYIFFQGFSEHGRNIFPFCIGRPKAFGPPYEHTMVNPVLAA